MHIKRVFHWRTNNTYTNIQRWNGSAWAEAKNQKIINRFPP
jgi:hypothetical protein